MENSCDKCSHMYVCEHRKEIFKAFEKIVKWVDKEIGFFISRECKYFSGVDTSKTFVEDMNFSTRVSIIFDRYNIKTLEDILKLGAFELYSLRNFGYTSLEEVGIKLQKYGVELHDMIEVSKPIYSRLKKRLIEK